MLCDLREEYFLKVFLQKTDNPLGGASFDPGVMILTILVKGH